MWDIARSDVLDRADLLLRVLDRLSEMPGVLHASLAGDQVRALTQPEIRQQQLTSYLAGVGIQANVEPSQPDM